MQREGTSRQGSIRESLIGEDAGFARYRLLILHHSTSSRQDAGVPRRPAGLQAAAAVCVVTAAGARNEMKVLCRAASQKLAMQQGRASVPSPRSLTIAFSALLSGRMLQPSGNKPPSPCRACVKYGTAVRMCFARMFAVAFCTRPSADRSIPPLSAVSPAASGRQRCRIDQSVVSRQPEVRAVRQSPTNKGLFFHPRRRARCTLHAAHCSVLSARCSTLRD